MWPAVYSAGLRRAGERSADRDEVPALAPVSGARHGPGRMDHDIVIVGGGPAGLSAALLLGRSRKRVLLSEAGPPRNAAAAHIQNFVTRDGTPPEEFRRLAHAELAAYAGVQRRALAVAGIAARGPGQFVVTFVDGSSVTARRVLLCVGVVDQLPALPGLAPLWGKQVHVCPYCHGWEMQDLRTGYLCPSAAWLEWGLLLRSWTREVVIFTDGAYAVEPALGERLAQAGVALEQRPVARLLGEHTLAGVQLVDGSQVALGALYVRPQQRQTGLVQGLGLALDELGYVRVDEQRQTSVPGIYAAGDLTTMVQAAALAAAAGLHAAAMVNHGLTLELALAGALD